MEALEEVMVGSQDHTHILKGKRTKRQRPQSPIPFAITANSSSGDGGGGGGGGGGGFDSNNNNRGENNNIKNTTMLSSPTTSNEYNQDNTEEEEDMANCLILLAQGQSRESPPPKQSDDDMGNYKFNSRRFMETANPTGTGKAGYYVYECKTCNRTFPSFQALGGHRASHKKPKAMQAQEKRNFMLSSDEEEVHFRNISSLSLQLSNNKGLYINNNNNNSNTKSKVHECSVCGAEFTSGQALGGHMRRHRGPIGTNTNLSLTPMVANIESEEPIIKKARNVLSLDLDLNLPAPEDDHRESKFSFASTQQEKQQQQHQQQQSPLVFSAPTLVDCHY